jgi:transcriptional regulator with XRE-family HTH domain
VSTRSERPFAEELGALLVERGLSQRKLAQLIDLNPSHLSRVLSGGDPMQPSSELIRRIARALNLGDDYFAELREVFVISKIRDDPELRDELYDRLSPTRPEEVG